MKNSYELMAINDPFNVEGSKDFWNVEIYTRLPDATIHETAIYVYDFISLLI